MTTPDPIVEGLIALFIVSVSTNLLLYWGIVCPALYRYGLQFPTGLLPWRYFHDLHGYRLILAAEGRSSNRYYIVLFLTWFNILFGLGLAAYVFLLTGDSDTPYRSRLP